MSDNLTIDLDTLQPQSATVKLNGETYAVQAPTVGEMLKLSRIADKFQKLEGTTGENGEILEAIDDLLEVLDPVIPGIKEGDVALTLQQAGALLGFVMQLSSPQDNKALKEAGIDPADSTEKKIPNDSLS